MPTIAASDTEIRIATDRLSLLFRGRVGGSLLQTHFGPAGDASDVAPAPAYPAAGDGYVFDPSLRIVHADGNTSTTLQLEWVDTTAPEPGIVSTRIHLKDPAYPLHVTLCFQAFTADDVITEWVEIRHDEPTAVTLFDFASSSPVLPGAQPHLTHWSGDWAKEMRPAEDRLSAGTKVIDSKLITRAQIHASPSFLVSTDGPVQENAGTVFGGSLAWSGSFRLAFEVQGGRLRALCGMNPFASHYVLQPGELFSTPRMVWTCSDAGAGGVARNLHRWARKHVVRGGDGPRAVLLNNWEATYFKFDQAKLVSLFEQAKPIGIDLFLLDDGWFGSTHPRDGDNAGLGDWHPDVRKLPDGIGFLCEQARARGLRFGIWLEPEMVNPASDLFTRHPDWVIRQPARELELQRNQLVLDLTRPEVAEFAFGVVDDLLSANPGVSYVKWDCNRFVTQPGSPYLPADRQSHLAIDYQRTLYDIMDRVSRRHPKVDLMLCSGGGGRVDFGALKFFNEYWPSDDTDPIDRVRIQYAFAQFFPACASCNHVTHMGHRPIKFAFDVAMSGRLGMDVDLAKYSADELTFATAAIALYKTLQPIIFTADVHRLESPFTGPRSALCYVLPDQSRAIAFVLQTHDAAPAAVRLAGLSADRPYRVREVNLLPGSLAGVDIDGQILTGRRLMEEGFVPGCSKSCDSVVLDLDAV